jgi:hypothetical protein
MDLIYRAEVFLHSLNWSVLGETFSIPCFNSALEFRGWKKIKIKFYFLTICSLSKMGKLKYLSAGQNKNKNIFLE